MAAYLMAEYVTWGLHYLFPLRKEEVNAFGALYAALQTQERMRGGEPPLPSEVGEAVRAFFHSPVVLPSHLAFRIYLSRKKNKVLTEEEVQDTLRRCRAGGEAAHCLLARDEFHPEREDRSDVAMAYRAAAMISLQAEIHSRRAHGFRL